jgi:acetyl esterase
MRTLAARAFVRLPAPLRAAIIGRRPVVVDERPLDRQVQLLLWAEARLRLPFTGDVTVPQARARFRRLAPLLAPTPPRHERAELTVAGAAGPLRARSYAPPGAGRAPLPGLVYLHGGGWVVGDLDTHDAVCATLAVAAGCRVISVDYRLAPEHPFPAPVDDAWAAFQDVVRRAGELALDPARVGIGGDSAGGNLSAAVALLARDAGGPAPRVQALVYASVDQTREAPSHALFGRGFLLTADDVRWFRGHYLRGDADRRDLRASPLLADLHGVAPAIVVTAGFDVLRDEGRAYAARLREAGVPVDERREPDLVHGFLGLAGPVNAARRAFDGLAASLRAALG